ncbi:hypothetical protein QJQ45_024886 [Haematococcus lacustris]|nr:hypothetical protein QJQ45_024886 [Haematococcus lacustris]
MYATIRKIELGRTLCVALRLTASQLQGCLVAGWCLAALPAPLLVAAPGAAPYLLTHTSSRASCSHDPDSPLVVDRAMLIKIKLPPVYQRLEAVGPQSEPIAHGQQTAPAMSQSHMQHQVAVDGNASVADGYSPTGEAPPPATRLLDLPPALLDDIACRVMQLGARILLPLTCRAFSLAPLLHVPALRIQLGRQSWDQLLTPRVVAALQARTSKLAPTIQEPGTEDSERYPDLLAHALAKLKNCAAVEVCKLVSSGVHHRVEGRVLRCPPGLAQHLLGSFPKLTALSFQGLSVSIDALASLLSHPPLAMQLQQLDLTDTVIRQPHQPGLMTLDNLLQGLRLKQLSLGGNPEAIGEPPLPNLQPLAQLLTQLHLTPCIEEHANLGYFMDYLQPLAQLQVLTLNSLHCLQGLPALLQALPRLHTLQLPLCGVSSQQQLDTLLAATQLTSVLSDTVKALDTSYADAPCSWQRLELTGKIGWSAIAYLPLHSLSQPLVLGQVDIDVQDIPNPVVAAALHRLAYAVGPASSATKAGQHLSKMKQSFYIGQQTAPAMGKRRMHTQVRGNGGALATDGYSPAGETPPPATRLLDLPPVLLGDIACRAMQLRSRSLLPLTCRAFSLAHLLHAPALRIQLGRQCCDQLLTPRVVAALQARTSKLALTLWQPKTEDSELYFNLLAHTLPKLDNCAAVEVCRLVGVGSVDGDRRKELPCSPDLAQRLVDSFPGLTALVLSGHSVTCSGLASLLSHPQLSRQLQLLELHSITVQQPQQPVSGAVTLDLFQGARLKHLTFDCFCHRPSVSRPLLLSLQPLAQHLTQLHLNHHLKWSKAPFFLVKYLRPLAQLQVLTLSHLQKLQGLTKLLQALPQLRTLQLPETQVKDIEQLDALLAATQLSSLQLDTVKASDTTYADAPCSWQRLELLGTIDWKAIAYLPLHSLSQPLVLHHLHIGVEDISNPEVAAALRNMAYACKVPMKIKSMRLYMLTTEEQSSGNVSINSTLLQQQRVNLAQLVALLRPLQCCSEVLFCDMHDVTAADVLALAPLCRDCTSLELYSGSLTPSLEFWRQLVNLMPGVQKVTFTSFEESDSAAMHQSLQLMAEQPWARWLDITICRTQYEVPSCWQSNNWSKKNVSKVKIG